MTRSQRVAQSCIVFIDDQSNSGLCKNIVGDDDRWEERIKMLRDESGMNVSFLEGFMTCQVNQEVDVGLKTRNLNGEDKFVKFEIFRYQLIGSRDILISVKSNYSELNFYLGPKRQVLQSFC